MSDRTLIFSEPGYVSHDGNSMYSIGDITVELMEDTVELNTQRFGKIDDIPTSRMVSIKFRPAMWNATSITKLFALGTLRMGAPIFGATDKPLDIFTLSGKRLRVPNAAVYAEPALRGTVKETIFGDVEYRGLVPNLGEASQIASFLAETTVTYPGDTGYNQAEIVTPAWAVSWGASPWDEIDLADGGWTITPRATIKDIPVDGKGNVTSLLTGYAVTVKFTPVNITRAAVLARLGFDVSLGGRKSTSAHDFTAIADGLAHIIAYRAHLSAPQSLLTSAENLPVGEMTLTCNRTVNSGVVTPLLYVGTEAPEA